MSNLIAIYAFFPALLFLILCNTSNATIVLSVINRLGIKALCECDITFGKISFSRLAKTLETILDTTLPKLIGR